MSAQPCPYSRIRTRRTTEVSPWVRLVGKDVSDCDGRDLGVYHSLEVADYVSVLAITRSGQIPVVRQFRPAVERETLEFPGGLLDPGEDPDVCAARELAEETGFAAASVSSLGVTLPDSGRLSNRMWCFFAGDVELIPGWTAEPGVELRLLTHEELSKLIVSGEFDHAPHLALYALASARGLI